MTDFRKLFEPIQIGNVQLRNRIVMPAMGTLLASDTGAVTDRLIDYHAERSRGLVGLNITEVACVDSPLGKTIVNQLRIDHDSYVPGLNHLAQTVHAYGGKIAVQLHHAGRQTSLAVTGGLQPVSASDVAYYDKYGIPPAAWVSQPRPLTVEEIGRLVEKFAESAERAKRAQMDAVELHGAHGYLIGQFLSPYTNKRTDAYGGSLERRMRFALEIVQRVREKVGARFPVIFRISADEMIPEGLKLDEAKTICRNLEEVGVDAINVSAAIYESEHWCEQPMATPRGCLTHLSAGIKEAVGIPVIAVGRINDPTLAERILQEEKADMVAMGRALLADPELPRKAREGRLDDIRRCTACNTGCIYRVGWQGLSVSCQVNPGVGREKEFRVVPVDGPRRILVIGGGPGGMEAALIASLRGHKVVLYEKNSELGGQVLLAIKPPHKDELRSILEYFPAQLNKLGVRLELGKEANDRVIESEKPDAVILAAGATPLVPEIRGADGDNVMTAWDVLAGRKKPEGKTVIVGGGEVGCETAEFVAESGLRVTVAEMLDYVAVDVEPLTRWLLLERLRKLGVSLMTDARTSEITRDGINVLGNRRGNEHVEAHTVVLALGSKASNQLLEPLRKKVNELYAIGDCVEPRNILEAIREGSEAGRVV
jgi:2,4-dienoyl-CoA reductase-like NADH-dependent reductase (Old Yellow Enzyme family)/thioredoxin reductase